MARPSVLSPASPGDQPSPVPCVLPTFCTGSVGIGDARSLHPAPRLPGASQSPLGVSGVDLRHRLPGHLHERQEVEFLRAAAAVASAQEIQVPGHLGQGRGARAWPGAGQGLDSSPAGGGSRGRSLLPSPLVHRGCHPCAGTFDLSLGSSVALRVPWSGRLPPGEPDQDSSGLVLTLVSGRPCPRLRLRPCTSAPVTPVGATLAPMTMTQTVLGSCVALNEREAPALTTLCEVGLPAQPACPSGREQPGGDSVEGRRPSSLHGRATPCGRPSSRWGLSGQVTAERTARTLRAGAAAAARGQQLRPGGRWPLAGGQGRGKPGPAPSALMFLLCSRTGVLGWRTEGSKLRAGRGAGVGHGHLSTRRVGVQGHRSNVHQEGTRRHLLAQAPTGADGHCLLPLCFRSLRRMTPSNCPTPSTTSLWGGGK